jgi:ATP-binding cassette subfamily B protein
VRFGRALLRADARLAILDEPFRGLDQRKRASLLARAREVWANATLICVTHDIEETLSFPRVIVVDDGRIVEDGGPAELASVPGSLYTRLLAAEREVRSGLWSDGAWRRWELREGAVVEESVERDTAWTAPRVSAGR